MRHAIIGSGILFMSLAPGLARAAEVECADEYGACTVSNDGMDFVSCGCADESGTGGTGASEWEDFGDAELMEICEAELAFCGGAEEGGEPPPDSDEGGCGGESSGDEPGGDEAGHHGPDAVAVGAACSVAEGVGDAGSGLAALLGLWAIGLRRPPPPRHLRASRP